MRTAKEIKARISDIKETIDDINKGLDSDLRLTIEDEKQVLTILRVVSMYKIIMAILILICLRLVFAIVIGEKCIGC